MTLTTKAIPTWFCKKRGRLLFIKVCRNILLYYWFQVFQGNFDRNTYKINMFPQPITARYVRLVALTWYNNISVRMEYLICWSRKEQRSHRSHNNWADNKFALSLKNVNNFYVLPASLDKLWAFSKLFVGHQPDVLGIYSWIAKNFQKISYFLSPDTESSLKLKKEKYLCIPAKDSLS